MKGLTTIGKVARYILWLIAKLLYWAYLLVFRSFLYVLTLFCIVYFAVNSSKFLPVLHPILDAELPGAIHVDSLQWGPLPWQTRIIGVDITDPNGTSVITADKVFAEVDLSDLFSWVIPELGHALFQAHWLSGPTAFHIRISRAEVYDFMVLLDFMEGAEPTLARAFDDGSPSVGPSRGPAKVDIPYAFGTRGRCVLVFPDFRMDYRGIEFRQSSVFVKDGGVTVSTPELDVAAGELLFDPAISPIAPSPWQIPIHQFAAKGFYLHRDYFDVATASATVGASSLKTFGSLYFRPNEPTSFSGEALLQLNAHEPVITQVLGEWANGPAQIWLSGSGEIPKPVVVAELRSPELDLNGLNAKDIVLDARLHHPEGGFAVVVERLESTIGAGRINLTNGWFQPARGHSHFEAAFAAVSPTAILTSPLVGLPIEDVLITDGAISGRTKVNIDYNQANLTLSATISRDPLVWDRGNTPLSLPLESTVQWLGNIVWVIGPQENTLSLTPIIAKTGDTELWAMGHIDLSRQTIRALVDLELPDLGHKLELTGFPGFGGSVTLTGAELSGPLMLPNVANATVKGKSIVTPWLTMDSMSGRIRLFEGKLFADKLNVASDLGTIGLGGSLQLFSPILPTIDPDLSFETTHINATAFPLARLLPDIGGRLDLSQGKAMGSLNRIESVTASAQVTLTELNPLPEKIDAATGSVSISKGHLRVSDAKLNMPAASSAHLHTLDVNLKTGNFVGNIAVDSLQLEQSRLVQSVHLPLFGTVSGDMTVQSGEKTARWEGSAKVADLRFDKVILGDAELELSPTEKPGDMSVTAGSFFHNMKLIQPSMLRIGHDGLPTRLWANATFEHTNLDTVLPFLSVDGIKTDLSGAVELDLDFRQDGPPPKITVSTPAGNAKAIWTSRNAEIVAETPLKISIGEQGKIDVAPVVITSGNRALSLCGTLLPDDTLEVALQVASPLDFWGLERHFFAMLEGTIVSAVDGNRPTTHPQNTCFYAPASSDGPPVTHTAESTWPDLSPKQKWVESAGVIRVFGTLKNPLLDGRLTVGPLATRPRGLADEIRLDPNHPWVLDLWTETVRNKVIQRLGSPVDTPWKGTLGEGSFQAAVSAMLRAWELEELDFRLDGVGIDYVSGDNYRFKFTTDVVAKGRRLSDVGRRRLDLSGKINVLEGTYAAGTRAGQDGFGRAATQRKISNYSKSLLESAPWLGPTALNLHVAGSNFLVRMALPVGETDVELRIDADVRGTIADPELVGRIDALPGGLLTNTIVRRELEVIKAIADFSGDPKRPMLDTETRAEVTFQEERTQDTSLGLNQVWSSFSGGRAEEKTVVIRIVVRGPVNLDRPGREFADLEVDLTSDGGGYERSELLTLLLTGAPPGTAEDGQEYGAAVNVVTDELAGVLAQTLLGAFVDGVQVGVTLKGGVDWALQKSLGRGLKFEVRGSEEASKRLVQPRFEFRLSDRVSFEGSLRYQQGQDFAGQTYETKLRYRIPLD